MKWQCLAPGTLYYGILLKLSYILQQVVWHQPQFQDSKIDDVLQHFCGKKIHVHNDGYEEYVESIMWCTNPINACCRYSDL